jgi:hypothetical protein
LTETPLYKAWCNMRARCYNPRVDRYPRYGGRGITVCKRWMKFEKFAADMGDPPAGMTLDRKNNDGDYTPSNCRWATDRQQRRNNSWANMVTIEGRTLCVTDWAKVSGVNRLTLTSRIRRGLTGKDLIA